MQTADISQLCILNNRCLFKPSFFFRKMEEVVIIADSKGKGYDFAKGIYAYLGKEEEKDISVKLIDIMITRFKDGEPKIKIAENIRRKTCFFIHDSNKDPYQWFTELEFTLEAMKSSSPAETNVVFPYMRFSRQDRKDESRVSSNAKVVANAVSKYADRCMTVDLHSPQIQEFFNIPVDNLYSFPTLINYLQENYSSLLENLVVVSPDAGGAKRAEALAKRFSKKGIPSTFAISHKSREKANEVAKTIIIGNVEGKNCLILDDIIDTGGTMISTTFALKEKGAERIFAYGTHALFTEGVEKFSSLDKVIVSDTIKTPKAKNVEILSLVDLFGEAIYRTVIGESLSILFNDE